MQNLIVMFVTTVCFLFLLKLKWPKNKNFYDFISQTDSFYFCCDKVPVQFKQSKLFFLTTSLHDLEKNKKITEEFTLDVTGSILVRKYHAEFVEAVDIDHYTEISLGDKHQVIVVEAKPTCNLPVWM